MAIETLGDDEKKLERKKYSAGTKAQRIINSVYRTIHDVALKAVSRFLDAVIVLWLAFYYILEAFVKNLTPASLRTLKSLRNKTILVTGGAGGVGQQLVTRLAKYNANVIVWDINEKALSELKVKLAEDGYKIHTYAVDLSNRDSIYDTANKVRNDVGHVDILINNAGIVCGQTFLELPDHMIEKTYQVNTLSCYWMAKAFLPDMIKHGRGHIATVGSLTGLLGTYNCTDYSGSKYATIGFHESLWTELKTMGYNKIILTMVSPYFINTGMFDGCKPTYAPMLEPEVVAKRVILALRREEFFCTVPDNSAYILGVKNYLPTKLNWLLQYRVLRLPQAMITMRKFKEVEAA